MADNQNSMLLPIPALAICGFSGSGKTTLLEGLIPELIREGLTVGVVKHDAHGFRIDQPGKDSDRLFKAGASVALRGPEETALRIHADSHAASLPAALNMLAPYHDLLLVEGHRNTPLPKIWLEHPDKQEMPDDVTGVLESLPFDAGRVAPAFELVRAWLMQIWRERSVMIALHRRTVDAEQSDNAILHDVALLTDLNNHDDTLLLEFPSSESDLVGEILLRTLRSRPGSAWLIAGTDEASLDSKAVRNLFEARQPGRWIITHAPTIISEDQVDATEAQQPTSTTLPILLEPQAIPLLENKAGDLMQLLNHPRCFHTGS